MACIQFFNDLFTLLDLLERLDVRNDILKDIDAQEKTQCVTSFLRSLTIWLSFMRI